MDGGSEADGGSEMDGMLSYSRINTVFVNIESKWSCGKEVAWRSSFKLRDDWEIRSHKAEWYMWLARVVVYL